MRGIKFRGKGLDGIWRFGSLVNNLYFSSDTNKPVPYIIDVENIDCYCLSDLEDDAGFYEVRPETVGQYTGLKDHLGADLYEGDVVECVSWNEFFSHDGKVMEPFRRRMYIEFRNGGFKLIEPIALGINPRMWDIIYNGDVTLIGNIYDNPELKEPVNMFKQTE